MNETGKILVFAGILLSVIGVLLWSGAGKWIGHLPGDLHIRRGNFSFHFPIVTCVVLSVLLTLIFSLFRRH